MSTATPPGDGPERPEGQGGAEGPDDAGHDEPQEGAGSPEVDVDAAWAQIMARWDEPAVAPGERSPARPGRHRRAGGDDAPGGPPSSSTPPQEHRRRRTDEPLAPPAEPRPAARPSRPERPSLPDGRGGTESDPLAEEHYVPPEPPPLPRAGWRTWLPWVGVLGVPFFFVLVVVLRPQLPSVVVLVAVLGFVAGFVTLVMRLPSHRDDDGDDGARV